MASDSLIPAKNPRNYSASESPERNEYGFLSPIIHCIQTMEVVQDKQLLYGGVFTSAFCLNQQRIEKLLWIRDYDKDIFRTLCETELKRSLIYFRSKQCEYRPSLLKLLKVAVEKHKLTRTTLHLAVYFLDWFMDSYTIRVDKLKLLAVTFLILAAKIEEADFNIPKFAELVQLTDAQYTLNEFKRMEVKVLATFNFDLIRPTAATFAEYFSNNIITTEDYYNYVIHWQNEIQSLHRVHYNQQTNEMKATTSSVDAGVNYCFYSDYEEMRNALIKGFFELIDVTLAYRKFGNTKPSILASSCIAAVRQIHGVFPIWTMHLINITEYTADVIAPFVEAIMAVYRLQYPKIGKLLQTPQTPTTTSTIVSCLCDSPDSGVELPINVTSDSDNENNCPIDDGRTDDEEDDESYHCLIHPLLAKRRRMY